MSEIFGFQGYVIRRKYDGFCLPVSKGRSGRGGSHVEPTSPEKAEPRIFKSLPNAKGFLTMWLKGKFVASRGSWCSGPDWDTDYYEDISLIPVDHRKRENMEIVPIKLSIAERMA